MMNIEKEYKRLKESAKLAADASFKLSEQVYNLKAENERLKLQLAEIGKRWDEISQMRKEKEDWMLRCAEKDNDIEILVSENAKLQKIRELLQDIKAIAEKCDLCDDCTGIDDCERYCGDSAEPCATRQMNNILEIINKAESEG